eukprot:scaffold2923_cov121-Cylindrotheca_fusiformis.AAC.17
MGLLKGIDPMLTADLLWVLRSMGHGDRLAVVDCNFPAANIARKTVSQKSPIMMTVSLPEAVASICSLLPLDYFEKAAAYFMSPQEGATLPPEAKQVLKQVQASISDNNSDSEVIMAPLDRFHFYEEAGKCYAIVQTLERRPYGNVILVKGAIGPDGRDLKP